MGSEPVVPKGRAVNGYIKGFNACIFKQIDNLPGQQISVRCDNIVKTGIIPFAEIFKKTGQLRNNIGVQQTAILSITAIIQ